MTRLAPEPVCDDHIAEWLQLRFASTPATRPADSPVPRVPNAASSVVRCAAATSWSSARWRADSCARSFWSSPKSGARSTHPRVAAWLSTFSETRRGTALLLSNALRLFGANDLSRKLDGLVAQLVETLPNPVAAFPVREVKDGKAAHGDRRDGG